MEDFRPLRKKSQSIKLQIKYKGKFTRKKNNEIISYLYIQNLKNNKHKLFYNY